MLTVVIAYARWRNSNHKNARGGIIVYQYSEHGENDAKEGSRLGNMVHIIRIEHRYMLRIPPRYDA